MNSSNWLYALLELEEKIHFDRTAPQGISPYAHIAGQRPVLISAPHSTIHMRNGRIKRGEGYTAAFAHLLANLTSAHAFFARYKLLSDPNWDRYSPYKSTLGRIIKQHNIQFVIDIHGMSNWHKFGVAIGTMNGRSCPNHINLIEDVLVSNNFQPRTETEVKQLSKLDLRSYVIDHSRFTGGIANNTITRFVSEQLHIGAVQFELCSTLRIVVEPLGDNTPKRFHGNPAAIRQLIVTFLSLIDTL